MRCICALLVCILRVQGDSSQVATSYEPRSQTFEGLKQKRLEKSIDEKIQNYKAAVGSLYKPVGFHGHQKHSNKSTNKSNPFLRDMQTLLNGTAMANITLRMNLHNMDKSEETRIRAQASTTKDTQRRAKHVEWVEHPTNKSAPVLQAKHLTNESAPTSQIGPTKNRGTSEDIHKMVADINATAKELSLNISRPAVDMKMAAEPKNPTRAEIQKANTKIFGESPGAWKREKQTERMQKMDLEIQKQMDQIKKHSTSSEEGAANNTITKDIQRIVADTNATAKELNINVSHSVVGNDTVGMKTLSKPANPTHAEIQKANSKIFGESSNAWKRESQTAHSQKMDRDLQKQMDQIKNHSTPSWHGADNHTVANGEVQRLAQHVQELNMSLGFNMSKNNQTNHTSQMNVSATNLRKATA